MSNVRIVVSVQKTIQETRYEPFSIKLSTEMDIGNADAELIQKRHVEIAEDLQDTIEEIIVRRAQERSY